MSIIVRLKSWKTFLDDGRSSVLYSPRNKHEVGVFVQVGFEPLKINEDGSNALNVDDKIVELAKHIQSRKKLKKVKK